MKKILVLIVFVLLFTSVSNSVHAATTEEMQRQVETLLLRIKELQRSTTPSGAVVTNNPNLSITKFDDAKTGKPKIVLTAPKGKKNKFNKSNSNDPIVIGWTAYNVPENTNLTLDLNGVKIVGPVGGGSAQFALPHGDSKGVYKWDIYGEGRASAGTYRVQLGLEECSSQGCTYNAHFPGQEENVTLYAQSRSAGVTIVGVAQKQSPTKVATVTTIDDTDTENPTVTGVALQGVTSVGFSIGQGDLIYGSGPINVTNNRWSHTISEDLRPGKYTLTLYVNKVISDTKTFTVK